MGNNPIGYSDPTGHSRTDDGGSGGSSCGGIGQPFCLGNSGNGNDNEDEDLEDDLEQDSCTYHLCSDDGNLYELGWENFGHAWSIYINQNANYGQRFGAGAYMGAWGGMHVAGAVGLAGLACVASGWACVKAVEGALGIGAFGAQAFGSNPNSGISIFGFTEDLAIFEGQGVNILQNVKNYTWSGTNVPYMDQVMTRGDTVVFVSNHLDDVTRATHLEWMYFDFFKYPIIELFEK